MEKDILKAILTKEAYERFNRVKLIKPELCEKIEKYLISLYKKGKVKEIDEKKLKNLLEMLSSKKEFRLIR